jgi:mRNA-degrading endonuclease RelE of RelBE toxin-antitoxin system
MLDILNQPDQKWIAAAGFEAKYGCYQNTISYGKKKRASLRSKQRKRVEARWYGSV